MRTPGNAVRAWALGVAAAVAAATLAAPPAAADIVGTTVVSSESSQPQTVPQAGGGVVTPLPGRAGARAPGDGQLGEVGASLATDDVIALLQEAEEQVLGEAVGPSTVIGRDGRKRVRRTTSFPARATVLIAYENGWGCTGWLASPDTVITAGHCVADGGAFFNVGTYYVAPGFNVDTAPYGVCTARSLHAPTQWVQHGNADYDYGAVKLNCDVGNLTGTFGYVGGDVNFRRVTIQGYPGGKVPDGAMWSMSGRIAYTSDNKRRIGYTIDTAGGQSGGPIWGSLRSPRCRNCVTGIHTHGVGLVYGQMLNSGTRILPDVFANIQYWSGL